MTGLLCRVIYSGVNFVPIRRAVARTYRDMLKNQTAQAAAALSYYSIFGVFPALILLSGIMAHVPLQNFFEDALTAVARVAPPGAMLMIDSVLTDILGRNAGAWLSLGTLGTLWVVSSAFDELIDALDAAYEVMNVRPIWKTRLLALALAGITGTFLLCGIATMVLGPRAGEWIAARLSLSSVFIFFWPFVHSVLAAIFAMLTVETIYFLAPNVKQTFLDTLPGAVLSVICWIVLSRLLGLYFRYFTNYNRTYGTLGGVMALLTWLYWAYFILIAGAELNAKLAQERKALHGSAQPSEHHRRSTDHA